MSLKSDLDIAVAQVQADASTMHEIVHGNAQTTVQTEGGPVDSLAKSVASLESQYTSGTVLSQVAAERLAAENAAAAAAASAGALVSFVEFWVDAVAGSDTNAGGQSVPFATLEKALRQAKPGQRCVVHLAPNQTHTLGADVALVGVQAEIISDPPPAGSPVTQGSCTLTAAVGTQVVNGTTYSNMASISLNGCTLKMQYANVDLPANAAGTTAFASWAAIPSC